MRFLRVRFVEKFIKHVEYQENVWYINGHQQFWHFTAAYQCERTLYENNCKLNLKRKKKMETFMKQFEMVSKTVERKKKLTKKYHLNECNVFLDAF